MYVPEEMKINKFKEVRIPSKGEYFNTGRFNAMPTQYGGDDTAVNVRGYSKVENAQALTKEIEKSE